MSARVVEVAAARPYRVHVGPDVLAHAAADAAQRERCALICDRRVLALHGERLAALDGAPRLPLEPGEGAKDLPTLGRALEFLASSGLDRAGLVLTLGGGVVSDLGGLAASLYMRGVDVVHCPTTLLAQVDASIGGKTALNLAAGKNLAGTVHQPLAVHADTATLATLEDAELCSGLGEVVKAALLGAPGLLGLLEERAGELLARDAEVLADVVVRCVAHKAALVAVDERDTSARRALNLGHTFAHAIEHVAGYGTVPHGVAVATGLSCALEASSALGILVDAHLVERARRLLARLGLPPTLAALRSSARLELPADGLVAAMRLDKKARAAEPSLVLLRRAGEPVLDVRPGVGFLRRLLSR